jgi:hypothetical protein
MAYQFASASSQYISSTHPVSAAPFTISAWARIDNTSGNKTVVQIGNTGSSQRFLLYFAGNTLSFFVNQTGSFAQAQAASTASANIWYHCCAVEASSSDHRVYFNGTVGTLPNPATQSPTGINALNIGNDRNSNANANLMTGQMADVAVWDVALTAAEIGSLADGMSADKIRPDNLVYYAPLVRELVEVSGGLALTNNGTATVSNHPRIYA